MTRQSGERISQHSKKEILRDTSNIGEIFGKKLFVARECSIYKGFRVFIRFFDIRFWRVFGDLEGFWREIGVFLADEIPVLLPTQ